MADDARVTNAVNQQNSEVSQAYNTLASNLQKSVGTTGGIHNAAKNDIRGAYNSGLRTLEGDVSGLNQRLEKAARRLGVGSATGYGRSRLAESLASQQARMTGQRTADMAAQDKLKAAYMAIAERSVGDARSEGTQMQTDLANKLRTALYGYLGDEEGARGQVDLARLQGQNDLERLRMQIAGETAQQNLKLAQIRASNAERAAAKQEDPLDRAMKEIQVKAAALELDKMMRGGDEPGLTEVGKGQIGVNEYIRDRGLGESGLGMALDMLTTRADERANDWASINKDFEALPYVSALARDTYKSEGGFNQLTPSSQASGVPDFSLDDLMTALQIYYGKTSSGTYG